jgi:hypothetical protein
MPDVMFGTPSGARLFDADQSALRKDAAEIEHQKALTRLNDAQAKTMLRKADQEDRRLAALSGVMGAPGGGGEAPSFEELTAGLRRAAAVHASIGEFETAGKIVSEVAGVQQKLATGSAAKALEQSRKLNSEIAKLRFIQETLSGVKDPSSHAQAVMMLQSNPLTADDPLPPALRTYNPNTLRAFLAGSPAAIKKREVELKEADLLRKQQDSASGRSVADVRKAVMERRAAVMEAREERIAKTGGANVDRGVGNPSSSEVKAMRQELKRQGLDAGDDTVAIQAQTLAEEARLLVRRNPGLSMSEARSRVIAESAERGELEQASVGGFTIPLSSKKFAPKTGSLSLPHALPKTAADLKPGAYYRSSSGEVRKFTGKGWETATPAAKVPRMSSVLEEDDDEGEE